MTTVRALIQDAEARLLAAHAAEDRDDARLQAELLYGLAAQLDRPAVIAAATDPPEQGDTFEQLLMRRLAHEPLAYILGHREFYGLTFEVGEGVLVPRPETETLVEAALVAVKAHPRAARLVRVADIGTGSGAIACAIGRHAPNTKIFATDASTAALQWAGRNMRRLGLAERLVLLVGDLLEPLADPIDVLVSNLPYVPTEEFEALPPAIREHEPRQAVEGGRTGTELIDRLFEQLRDHLAGDASAVLLEVGAGQAGYVARRLEEVVTNATVRTHRDLRGIRRVVEARSGYAAAEFGAPV
jgi:release factor glutamine methyltransferase